MIEYWREATALVDALLPIPPRVCLNKQGRVMRTARCDKCPMLIQCTLVEP